MIDAAWTWLVRLLENVWNFVGFHSPVEPDLDAIQWPLISNAVSSSLDTLARAVAGITIGAKPQYEEMLFAPADWKPDYRPAFPECGDE